MTKKDSFIALPTWAVDERNNLPKWWDYSARLVFIALLYFRQRYTSAKGLRGREARESKAKQMFHASYPRIGGVVGLSRSTAARRCDLFIRLGVLELVERGGPGRENLYRLHEEKLYHLFVSDSVPETPYSVRETLPTSPTDTISCQADTPVRNEVRGERQEENGDGNRAPTLSKSKAKGKDPTELVADYRDFLGRLNGDTSAFAGVCRALAAQLQVSEEQARSLLHGARHG